MRAPRRSVGLENATRLLLEVGSLKFEVRGRKRTVLGGALVPRWHWNLKRLNCIVFSAASTIGSVKPPIKLATVCYPRTVETNPLGDLACCVSHTRLQWSASSNWLDVVIGPICCRCAVAVATLLCSTCWWNNKLDRLFCCGKFMRPGFGAFLLIGYTVRAKATWQFVVAPG